VTSDELVRQAQSGNSAALEEICRREWRPVYDLVYRTVQNHDEAQDLTQEVFLRAVRSISTFQDAGRSMHGWLVTIALNLLRDRWRRHRPMVYLEDAGPLRDPDIGPEQQVIVDLDRRQILDALSALPDDYQIVLRLRLLESRSSNDVAALMGRTPEAVRQLQRRALMSLRSALREGSMP
jgi:RNA polymerase sigma-70 factor, ECF subfamily